MKIYVCPSDAWGCGHYRLVWPAEVVERSGDITIQLIPPGQQTGIGGITRDDRLVSISYPEDADVVVFQRPAHRRQAEAIPHLRKAGVTVVVDMDDDLSLISPRNPAYGAYHPGRSSDVNWHHAAAACRAASLVTVSTDALAARYGAHGRVRVLRNCVPEAYLAMERTDEFGTEPTVGWAGSLHSHPHDLTVVGSGIAQSGLPVRNIGPEEGIARALGVPSVEATGELRFGDWALNVATLGVGLCPLEDSRFNAAKSWLKPLEMAAVGVPWVGSPRTEYARLHREGCGLLAQRPRDWAARLRDLRDPSLRADLSAAGRDVARTWTYQANGWRWAEAWTDAVANDRQVSRA
jgi:hypothetical protein